MGGIFQRDLDEPKAISPLGSSSLRGTSSLSRGVAGTEQGCGSPSLSVIGLVLRPSKISVEFRPLYNQKTPLKI